MSHLSVNNPLVLQREDSDEEYDPLKESLGRIGKRRDRDIVEEGSSEDSEAEEAVKFMDVDKFEKEIEGNEEENETFAEEGNGKDYDDMVIGGLGAEEADMLADFDSEVESEASEEAPDNNEPKFTSFGLKEELEEGRFDENENFIRYASEDEETKAQDSWLEGISKKDIKRAREAERKKKEAEEVGTPKQRKPVDFDVVGSLILLLDADESPEEKLQLLNTKKINISKKYKNKAKKQFVEKDKEEMKHLSAEISQVMKLSSAIAEYEGYEQVMTMSKEQISRKVPREKVVKKRSYEDEKSEKEVQKKEWEFRWLGKSEIYGPYTRAEIENWKRTYFKGRVEVRRAGEDRFTSIEKF